ncbi:isochorismatase family protein (plasmid) [Priestia megaterium]|uniref:isochorismatase family protein n=1 Tax=Priestia megaterium TaxID=1404 RepID=UPI00244B4F03|nr:isochorismatase family protein [Priestia megaterium]MDH2449547.1 isochorismatase family protein [Priestia megaterium]MDL5149005.1 isochorismatase family protein [Priestia megaterium]
MSKKTALLLIDVQNIMFSYEGGSLWNEQQVLQNITYLREKAHQSNVPIIYIQHTDPSYNSMLSEGKVGSFSTRYVMINTIFNKIC